jgi:drug/metabolite transporter (DMT)-like permease
MALPASIPTAKFDGWMSLIVLGVVCSAIAFILFFDLIKEIGSARATLITYPNTAVAFLLGILFLSEPITLGMIIGFPLVITGSYFASKRH